ncbi:MAG: cell division protein CrgA [Janthinobacterium lividum]
MARRKDQREADTGAKTDPTPVNDTTPADDAATPSTRLRRVRKDATLTGTESAERAIRARNQLTPRWWIWTMVGFMVLGLIWIVVFYLSSSKYPVPDWHNWNLVVGFGLVLVGFAMTTRWR